MRFQGHPAAEVPSLAPRRFRQIVQICGFDNGCWAFLSVRTCLIAINGIILTGLSELEINDGMSLTRLQHVIIFKYEILS